MYNIIPEDVYELIREAIETEDYESFCSGLDSGVPLDPDSDNPVTSQIGPNDLDEVSFVQAVVTPFINLFSQKIGSYSFLMIAADVGCLKIMKELINRGADIDYQDVVCCYNMSLFHQLSFF